MTTRTLLPLALLGVVALFALPACSGSGGDDEYELELVCNQRERIGFAGLIANSLGVQCNSHYYDNDKWPAAFDRDDRENQYEPDMYDGDNIGDINECRVPDTSEADGFHHDWNCITAYWAGQLDTLCAAYADGTFEGEAAYASSDEAAFMYYCPQAPSASPSPDRKAEDCRRPATRHGCLRN